MVPIPAGEILEDEGAEGLRKTPLFLGIEVFFYVKRTGVVRVNNRKVLTAEISALVTRLVKEIVFGSLIFVVQDYKIIQIERNEKYQFPIAVKKKSVPMDLSPIAYSDPLQGIQSALSDLQFGQVVLKIQDGVVVQVERTEKRRFTNLTGLSGDGI